ncbi:hypothetical protein HGRIS_002190 [Hohenbuehelia grisea]|uniref:Cytochrome P450 n=1 Tax=Hohenbuehelia grisea TaxID=104357 RepID=A0ABR3JJS2_9AGAR
MSALLNALLDVLVMALKAIVVVALLLLARGAIWLFNMLVVMPPFDPLRKLPGPDTGALQNHFREVMDPAVSPETHEEWVGRYGKTFRFHGFGKHDYRLMSFDQRVISHVLNSPIYEKPWQTRLLLSRLLGRGIFAMEGEEHRIRRKLIGPAFTTQSIKAMTPVFFQKAEELRDKWTPMISTPSQASSCPASIDISHWISRATFDVIGLAGFDYHFHSVHDESEPVYLAYRRMFNVADKGPGLKGLLSLFFPIIETIFPDADIRTRDESLRVIHAAGKTLVANKKAEILAEKSSAQDIEDKDILSLLIKQNLSEDPSKRLSDSDLLDQLSTFLFAGSDSTALTISYCLNILAENPEIQTRLRDEILSLNINSTASVQSSPKESEVPDSGFAETFSPIAPVPPPPPPSTSYSAQAHSEALDTLPYLDAVVRETLRICPTVHGTIRMATQDDEIPISHPVHMRDGRIVGKGETIRIRKGSYIHVPIEGLNYSEEIWGKDARTFNPDRWLSSSPRALNAGLANVMTFSFGPHSCPGWKFSVMETKAFIASLLPHFEFRPAEGVTIKKFNAILTRPYVMDKWEEGTKLPLDVRPYVA